MALYLVKLDPDRQNKLGEPRFVAIVGRIVESDDGYRFIPQTSAHKASRRRWPSANACIPAWTKKCGLLCLFDESELAAATKSAV